MMMHREPEALFDKYAKLVPKSPVEDELAMSTVHLSKNWKVPPRMKPGRRRGFADSAKRINKRQECSPKEDEDLEDDDSQEKKKKQNREAQRAYRERRANRIQELESTVETLQNLVKVWQKKCKAMEEELASSNKELDSLKRENMELKDKLALIGSGRPSGGKVRKNSKKADKSVLAKMSGNNSPVMCLDPLLNNMIKNFKPMKAVKLKRNEDARDMSSMSDIQAGSMDSYDMLVSLPAASGRSRASAVNCGFCTDSTACVCKELEDDARKTENAAEQPEDNLEPCKGSCSGGEMSILSTRCCKQLESSSHGRKIKKKVESNLPPDASCEGLIAANRNISTNNTQQRGDSPAYFEASNSLTPNTMDPNFKPGTCGNCQRDPMSKAFCEAVYGPIPGSDEDARSRQESRCCGPTPGSCAQCQTDPQSRAFCEAVHQASMEDRDLAINRQKAQSSLELIPVSDAYQRVRKYMRLKNIEDKRSFSNMTASTLPLPLHKVASGLRTSGRKVESRSVDDAIRELDKNAMG